MHIAKFLIDFSFKTPSFFMFKNLINSFFTIYEFNYLKLHKIKIPTDKNIISK